MARMGTNKARLTVAMLLTGCAAFAPVAMAQEVTLQSADGSIDLAGRFIGLEGNAYVIESAYGALRVPADLVECIGAACPGTAPEAPASRQAAPPQTTDASAPRERTQEEILAAFAAARAVGPVEWDVSLWGKRRAFTEHVEKLAELISAKTGGDFTLNISYGGLSDSRENLDGISEGKFEMAQFCAGYHRDKNPSITVLELPFLGVGSLEQEIEVSRAVYGHPATVADMARWNATLLMPSPLPQYNIAGTGTPPTSLRDFEGLTIRASGGVGEAVASLGATLVPMPATQVKAALDDGQIRAVSFAPHAHMAFGTLETSTWWTTNLNPGTVNCPVVMNSDAFETLPEAYQAALTSSVDEALDHYVAHYTGATMEAWGPALEERGIAQLTLTDDIIGSIRAQVAAPAAETWIEENAAKGLPARELYKLVTDMVTEGRS